MICEYYQLVKKDEKNLPAVLEYFNNQYEEAKNDIKIKGILIDNISIISSNYEKRFSQLQEIEAILAHFENKMKRLKGSIYQKLMETSQRALSANDIKNYIDGDERVCSLQSILNEIALTRNLYISLSKGFESMNYQLNNLTKLYAAGCEGVIIS